MSPVTVFVRINKLGWFQDPHVLLIFPKGRCTLGAVKVSVVLLRNPRRAAEGTHLEPCAARGLLSRMKTGQQPDPCPVCCTEIQERSKVHLILHRDGPEAGCQT